MSRRLHRSPSRTPNFVAASLLGAAGLAQAQQAGSVIISLGGARDHAPVDSADPRPQPCRHQDRRAQGPARWLVASPTSERRDLDRDPAGTALQARSRRCRCDPGRGVLGTVKALPATAIAQYRFGTSQSLVRPFVGGGRDLCALLALTRHGHPVRHHRRHPGQAHHLVDEERLWTHAADRRQRQLDGPHLRRGRPPLRPICAPPAASPPARPSKPRSTPRR